ncbi:M48 family metalloprotease [Streptomyces goshikiensis]|uniref:M48 family metalloprotease n=1 Tax=Streptomyces goshikiensis TaxID=1942 RepID=UPI0036806303
MYLRASLFWLALTIAAFAIAFPTESQRHADEALGHLLCSNGVRNELLQWLPLTPEEERLAAASPLWQRRYVPDEYRAQVNSAIDQRCGLRSADRPELRAALTVGALGCGGFVLYWSLPRLSIRCRRLEAPEPTAPARAVDRAVHALAAEAGVPAPMVLVDGGNGKVNANAFGNVGRRYVEVTAGFERRLVKDNDQADRNHDRDRDRYFLDAVIRHELGHIHNRDLDVTLAVTAVWWTFLALVVGAFGLSLTEYAVGGGSGLRQLSLQLGLLTGMVYASRNCFLQSREFHADRFAASCPTPGGGASAGAFDGVLGELSASQHRSAPDGSAWPFGTHPSLTRRRAALSRPAVADEFTGWEVALIGCLLAFSVNLLLGLSFQLELMAIRFGVMPLSDVELGPLYVWLSLPLLLLVGPMIALGVRYSVVARGGVEASGRLLAARLVKLAGCLWAGLCCGSLALPGPLVHSDGSTEALLWRSHTASAALALAVMAVAVVGLGALVALGCDALRMRRGPSTALLATYGAPLAVVAFPGALPSSVAPLLRTAVLGVPVLAGLAVLARRRDARRPVDRGDAPAGKEVGSVSVMSSPMGLPLLLLCHLVTLGMACWALVSVGRLLRDFAPTSVLYLVAAVGLAFHTACIGGAALAAHDGMFRRRARAATGCLAAAALAALVQLTVEGQMSQWLFLILPGTTAGVVLACEASAAAVYDVRHGARNRPTDRPRRAAASRPPSHRRR